jgi:hypothetical protein
MSVKTRNTSSHRIGAQVTIRESRTRVQSDFGEYLAAGADDLKAEGGHKLASALCIGLSKW